MQWTGSGQCSPRKRIASRMSSGPVEQLRPITSTFSASSVVSTEEMSVPSSILPPLGSSETEAWIGILRPGGGERLADAEDRGLDLEDVLRGLDDQQVRAALEQALGLLGEDGDELAEADLAEARVLGGGEEAGGADRARDEAVLADRLAGDLGGPAVDLQRVLADAPLVELEPLAWKVSVSTTSAPASIIDSWTPWMTSGRLSTSASWQRPGEAVVALEVEVELLERGAHAAVEDDDAVAGGGEEVTHGRQC